MRVNVAFGIGAGLLCIFFLVRIIWNTVIKDQNNVLNEREPLTSITSHGTARLASRLFNLTRLGGIDSRNEIMTSIEAMIAKTVQKGKNDVGLLESLQRLERDLHRVGKNRTGFMNWLKDRKQMNTDISSPITISTKNEQKEEEEEEENEEVSVRPPPPTPKQQLRASQVVKTTVPTKPKRPALPAEVIASSEPIAIHSSERACMYDFKVYVYELPSTLGSIQLGHEARRNRTLHVCQKCILEQFALEYIINDFFTQFCGRTYDPNQADFFYLPLTRDAEYRHMLDNNIRGKRQPSLTEQALLDILEKGKSSKWTTIFNITDKYWRAKAGADHILVMPAPVTNFRHETGMRGFFHYMPHLHTPIFLGVEYSVSFVKEYPVCSSQKNIVMPYPTTDPDLFNGKLWADPIQRNSLLFYAGGLHGDCIEVRRAMRDMMKNSTKLKDVLPDVKAVQTEREHGFRAATFCPVPVGDSPSSKRMYDVLHFGCIPVVLSDDLVWAYSRQTGGPLDHTSFSLQLPQAAVQLPPSMLLERYKENRDAFGTLPTGELLYDLLQESYQEGGHYENGRLVNSLVMILRKIPKKTIEILEEGVAEAAPKFRYFGMDPTMKKIPTATHTLPTGGAMTMLALLLSQRKAIGVEKIRDMCLIEKKRDDHKYIAHYPCERTVRRRLAISITEGRQFIH